MVVESLKNPFELSAKDIHNHLFGTQVCMGLKEKFNKKDFNKIKNWSGWTKPIGGLWCCPLIEEGPYLSAWHKCMSYLDQSTYERKYHGYNPYDKVMLFNVKMLTRFYVINNLEDAQRLINNYGYFAHKKSSDKSINFEKLSKDYDAMYLTPKGLVDNYSQKLNFNSWDISSILILNADCIDTKSITYTKLNQLLKTRVNAIRIFPIPCITEEKTNIYYGIASFLP